MPGWYVSAALYKGLFLLVFILLVLEYLFGSITETKQFFVFNGTKFPHQERVTRQRPIFTFLSSKPKQMTDFNVTTTTKGLSQINITEIPITTNLSEQILDVSDTNIISNGTQLCPDVPPNLQGRVPVLKSPAPSVSDLEYRFNWLQPGGHCSPPNCRVLKSVAIIVPFRCRGEHLLLFLQHMHPFLRRQQLDYTIFVIEQEGDSPFNRAMLMNVGFVEALRIRQFDCFIFHDVDLLPEDDRNLYNCPPSQPRHMSVAIDIMSYKLPYTAIFGGVSAINREHFQLLNGFSNSFWGWGGEDDDMSNRIRFHNLYISRYPVTIARYTMLTHIKDKPSPNRYDVLKKGIKKFNKDGLNNLKYKLIESKKKVLYTWLLVRLEKPS